MWGNQPSNFHILAPKRKCCVSFTIPLANKVTLHFVADFFLLTGQLIKAELAEINYHRLVQVHRNCSINCFLCVFKSKLAHLCEHLRHYVGSSGVWLSCKWSNAGVDRNGRRKEEQTINGAVIFCSLAEVLHSPCHLTLMRHVSSAVAKMVCEVFACYCVCNGEAMLR